MGPLTSTQENNTCDYSQLQAVSKMDTIWTVRHLVSLLKRVKKGSKETGRDQLQVSVLQSCPAVL